MSIFKRNLVFILVAIFLSGCGVEDHLKDLNAQSKSSDFNVLVEARKQTKSILDSDPEDKGAKKILRRIDDKIVENIRGNVNRVYSEGDLKRALELSGILLEIEPNDEEARSAYARMNKEYSEQLQFDELESTAHYVYEELLSVYNSWNNLRGNIVLGNFPLSEVENFAREHYPFIQDLRKELEDEVLKMDSGFYRNSKNDLFKFVKSIEDSLSGLLLSEVKYVSDLNRRAKPLTPESFTSFFTNLQDRVNAFLNQVDKKGNKLRNVQGNLNFSSIKEPSNDEVKGNLQNELEEFFSSDEEEE